MLGFRKDEKGIRFQGLINKIDEALKDGYYVEAMAITYALFEERTYRLMDRLNLSYRERDHKLFHCINMINDAIQARTISVTTKNLTNDDLIDLLEDELITSNLFADIQDWRDKRNDVMHDLAKTTIDYSSLRQPSEDGRELFAKYTAIIMRIKKRVDET